MMVPSDFTPVGNRARWAIVLLAATIVIDVIAIGFDVWDIATINSFLDGRNLDIAPLLRSDHRQTLIGRAQLAAYVVAAILFIRWFHASYRNLRSLGTPESRFKPGWAIGVWFVPILNLWRPKQIADEIWNAGDPEVPLMEGEEAPWLESTRVLTLWWSVWIVSVFIGRAVFHGVMNANTLADVRHSDKLDIAGLVADGVAAVLAILVIQHATRRQLNRAHRVAASA